MCMIGISSGDRMGVTLLKGDQKVSISYTAFDKRSIAIAKGVLPYV